MLLGMNRAAAVVGCLAFATPVAAETVTGTLDASITLTKACKVNGATTTSGVSFGSLAFGTHTTLFTEATATADGNGSGAISIQCTPGADATLKFNAGQNDGQASGSGRAMKSGTYYVPYDIFSDAGYSNKLTSGSGVTVTADGTAHTVNVYGKALGASGLVAGTYSDVITVELSF